MIFPDIITVTEKIETYIQNHFGGRLNGAMGSSLGSTFVGQLIQRENIHIDHGIFGSPDLDQSGKFSGWLQSKLVVPLLTSFTMSETGGATEFVREYTLASGGPYCDCGYKKLNHT